MKLNTKKAIKLYNKNTVSIQLWDVSGDLDYEDCWTAIQENVNGLIIVYNPENPQHSGEVETWYEWFVEKNGLKQEQCLMEAQLVRN